MSTTTAIEELAQLVERRARAEARVSEVEAQARAATETRAAVQEALTEFERRGNGVASERKRIEAAFASARATAAEPWAERVEGARRGARDADREVRVFVGANLPALVETKEADGQIAATNITAIAETLLDAITAREAIAQQLSGLLSMTTSTHPGDVSHSACEGLASELRRLLEGGGETAPFVRHDRYPALFEQPVVEIEHEHAVPA